MPTLRVVNQGPRPVLLLDGEQLIGAKQNRVLNVTVLVAAHTKLDVPVSCVEQGRWRFTRPSFVTDDYLMNADLRVRRDLTGLARADGERRRQEARRPDAQRGPLGSLSSNRDGGI